MEYVEMIEDALEKLNEVINTGSKTDVSNFIKKETDNELLKSLNEYFADEKVCFKDLPKKSDASDNSRSMRLTNYLRFKKLADHIKNSSIIVDQNMINYVFKQFDKTELAVYKAILSCEKVIKNKKKSEQMPLKNKESQKTNIEEKQPKNKNKAVKKANNK